MLLMEKKLKQTSCKNCDSLLAEDAVFCKSCGQKSDTARIDMHFLSHNIIHTLTHGDKGIFHLIKQMTLNPGKVISEYVAGKRKLYFNPFNFFFITITISALLTHGLDLMQTSVEHPNAVSEFISKKFNLVIMVSLPIITSFTFLFFRKAKMNYAENLVFHCFTSGYRIVFFVLIFALFVPMFREYYTFILYAYLVCFLVYLIWAAKGFFKENLFATIIKTILAFVLTQFVITSLVYVGILIWQKFLI
jgi:hypothetical protein